MAKTVTLKSIDQATGNVVLTITYGSIVNKDLTISGLPIGGTKAEFMEAVKAHLQAYIDGVRQERAAKVTASTGVTNAVGQSQTIDVGEEV